MNVYGEFDADVVAFMWSQQKDVLTDMVRRSMLSAPTMRRVFDHVRPQGGVLIHYARLSLSHPDSEVRAMASVELCAFIPMQTLRRHLWS